MNSRQQKNGDSGHHCKTVLAFTLLIASMSSSFVVVGAGVFGASTALELAKAGHDVTVLERSSDGYHAPDAASNDINKIIRPDYSVRFDEREIALENI